jgi:hypothetical protein
MFPRTMRPPPRRSIPALPALLGACLLATPHVGEAQAEIDLVGQMGAGTGSVSEEGGLFLLLPIGAQGVGLGRAMTALSSTEGAFWNPAGLAGIDRSRFLLYHGNQVVGDATGVSVILTGAGTPTLGLSYGLLDIERLDVTDDVGDVVGSIVVRGHQGIVSGATELAPWMSGGVNLKVVRFGMSCRGQCPQGTVQSTSYAVDAGIKVRPLESRPFDLGVMVAHLGPGMRVENGDEAEPLPSRVRVGASYLVLREFLEEEVGFRILAEVEDRVRSLGSPSFYFGSELRAGTEDQLYVRGGYIFGDENQLDGAAVGVGLRYERFEFGIARSLARGGPTADREPMHFTLGVGF